ncbi:uncharacterized protein LOC109831094 [Asparagus officinalis]|uniref:uncharacterized protein LOC109831094 n=1 Tax=Asparagus officinalis TaxID=4686 RepID=UPI00098E2B67|nr:uncharacterized protein LOC109831094 [Asparagus officinalis]
MANVLKVKNKLRFINATLQKTTPNTPEVSSWSSCNSMLISWIFNSIERSIQSSIAYEETTKAIWQDLRDRFSIWNAPRIHELKGQIASTRQNRITVMTYYTRLRSMWDELCRYSRVSSCTCEVVHDFLHEHEEEKLHQFLMGLDDAIFGIVRSQILNMEPLPLVNKAYAMIAKE